MAVLTVSREFGSGGREIGQTVAESLGYDYLDKSAVLSEIRTMGSKWEEWGKDLDEHCPTVWEKYDWSFRGYGALMQSIILRRAVKGRIVIMGRGGNFLLKDIPFALRIRVAAPMETRIDRIMIRESLDRGTAKWLAQKTDHDRARFIHALYGKQWEESAEFDRLFDTSQLSLDDVIAVVKDLLVERDRAYSEEARKTLEMRAAAARVKAGLLTDPRLFVPVLDVFPEGAVIVVRGVIHTPKEQCKLEEAARRLAGNDELRCDLHYRS
jgi:cytidylate kinase